MNSYPLDGRMAGAIMVLQVLVAGLLKQSVERNALLTEVGGLAASLTDDAMDAMAASDMEKWDYLSQLQEGAQEAIKALTEMSQS